MKYPYKYALIGLLYYPLQHIIYYLRFKNWNTIFMPIDVLLPITGVLSFALLFYFLNKETSKHIQHVLWGLFLLVCLPLSILGTLAGGLLGPIGIVVFGLVPVAAVLLIGKGIAGLKWK